MTIFLYVGNTTTAALSNASSVGVRQLTKGLAAEMPGVVFRNVSAYNMSILGRMSDLVEGWGGPADEVTATGNGEGGQQDGDQLIWQLLFETKLSMYHDEQQLQKEVNGSVWSRRMQISMRREQRKDSTDASLLGITVCPRERLQWCYTLDKSQPPANVVVEGSSQCPCDCRRDQGLWEVLFEHPGKQKLSIFLTWSSPLICSLHLSPPGVCALPSMTCVTSLAVLLVAAAVGCELRAAGPSPRSSQRYALLDRGTSPLGTALLSREAFAAIQLVCLSVTLLSLER